MAFVRVLAVTPRTLYYVADVSTRSYGVSNLPPNGALTGFVNGDTVASAHRHATPGGS